MIDVREIVIDPSGTASTFPLRPGRTRDQAGLGLDVGPGSSGDATGAAPSWQSDATNFDVLDWQSGPVHRAPSSSKASQLEFIRGPLPDGYQLVLAIPVELRREGLEMVASQPDLRLHSFGPDVPSALENFKAILVEQLERLERYEGRLSPAIEGDLRLLRALLRRDA